MKQMRRETLIRLADLLAGRDAWGTDHGAKIFAEINLRLLNEREGTLALIDFADVKWSDVSFQREAVVETLRKHRPGILFIVINLTDPDLRENLEMALERKGESLLLRDAEGISVIGRGLTMDQLGTLQQIWSLGEVTSSMLATGRVKLSTISSRLAWLWKAGLVERVEGTSPTGGREHSYRAVT